MARPNPAPCRPKADLEDRPLLSSDDAGRLEDLFKLLANDTRLRLLHALAKHGEIAVGDLAEAVGMKPQAISNQLQRLQTAGIVGSRRDGNNIRYRVVDRCVLVLMDRGLCLLEENERRRSGRADARPVPVTKESVR